MTNEQIIEGAKRKLVADGKIKPEDEIHTYKHWRSLGYQVFRGEKAICALNIWTNYKRAKREDEDEDGQEPKRAQTGAMRLKRAYFFGTQQVFKLEED